VSWRTGPRKVVWFDCHGGASGDMLLGALLDAGADLARVNGHLARLGLGLDLTATRVHRGGLAALKATVMVAGEPADPSEGAVASGHQHLHRGQQRVQAGATAPTSAPGHRSLGDITGVIVQAALPGPIADMALRVFRRLAEAEARVHGSTVDDVHFHEVGAADAIGDVVGVCACLHDLGVDEVLFGRIPLGGGTIRAAHGELPVPAPATMELITGLDVWDPGVRHEMVTPTGAALLVALGRQVDRYPEVRVLRCGTGAGTRDTPRANVVRAVVGAASGPPFGASGSDAAIGQDEAVLAECNLDDTTGQVIAAACEALLRAGALDAWWTPCGMKKGRPGVVLSFLARPGEHDGLVRLAFAEVPTLGVRLSQVWRQVLARKHVVVDTPYGGIRVKLGGTPGADGERAPIVATPEFEDCRQAAERAGVPVRLVIGAASEAAGPLLRQPRS
jgi:uncharacterized protein (TIGR00299 family) protein